MGDMPFRIKVSLYILAGIALLTVILPLLIPVGQPPDAKPFSEVVPADAEITTTHGLRLHSRTWDGVADAPVIIAFHSYGFDSVSFRGLGEESPNTIVAIDRPGFGLTERIRDEALYTDGALVRMALDLVQERGYEHVVALGHGTGAGPALLFAQQHPEVVDEVILLAPIQELGQRRSWFGDLVMNSPQMRRLGPVLLRPMAHEAGDVILQNAFEDQALITQERLAEHKAQWQMENWDFGLWAVTHETANVNLLAEAARITQPLLLIHGEPDRVMPLSSTEQFAQRVKTAEVVVIDECGHALGEECPIPVANAITAWLSTLEE